MPENDETLDRICGQLEIYQARRGYRFGIEALLLAGFVRPGRRRLLDLGTGSGVLPLVLTHFGKVESAVGVEIQPALADRARRSVAHNGLAGRVEIVEADLRAPHDRLEPAGFDLVVCNPPYGRAGTGDRSPNREKALARHEVQVTLEDVVAAAARLVAVRGPFDAVVPPARLPELLALCADHDLRPARLRLAHGRAELGAKHCLVEAIRAGRMDLAVEPPLVIYDETGAYTSEVQEMLYPSKMG